MTLVVPRMIDAAAGFIAMHGAPPTKMIVPTECWPACQAGQERIRTAEPDDVARAAVARLELVPVPRQLYIALDEQGRLFDVADAGAQRRDGWSGVRESVGGVGSGASIFELERSSVERLVASEAAEP